MPPIIHDHALLAAAVAALIFSALVFIFFMKFRSKQPGSAAASSSRNQESSSKDIRSQRVRAEDRIAEAKSGLEIHANTSGDQVHFRLMGASNMLEALIYIELINNGPYTISISRINWDLWRSGLHMKTGVLSEKITLEPNGGKKELLLREVVQNYETSDYAIGSQSNTDGYLEGLMQCETEFGRFKKPFTILDMQFSISDDAKLKLKAVMNQNYLDGLTGLLERKFLEENLQSIINRNAGGNPFSFAMIDIDNFKVINDTYGHLAGDEVIRTVCDKIKDAVGEQGLCIRYGGDEFAIILQNSTLEEARNLFEKVRADIEASEYSQPQIKATISVGIATITEPVDFKILMKNADDVLRVSKETGRNKVTINQRKIKNDLI